MIFIPAMCTFIKTRAGLCSRTLQLDDSECAFALFLTRLCEWSIHRWYEWFLSIRRVRWGKCCQHSVEGNMPDPRGGRSTGTRVTTNDVEYLATLGCSAPPPRWCIRCRRTTHPPLMFCATVDKTCALSPRNSSLLFATLMLYQNSPFDRFS